MNDSEKQTIVFIPRNFIEKGTFMGGMFKIRNAIEGGILAVLIAVPVIQLPLSLTPCLNVPGQSSHIRASI